MSNSSPPSSTGTVDLEQFFIHTVGAETVNIYVGPDRMVFNIHAKLLVNRAATIANLLEQEKDDGLRFLNLPDVDTKIFDVFVYWAYKEELPTSADNNAASVTANTSERIKLAIFAEQYSISSLFSCVRSSFEHFFDQRDEVPSVQDIAIVYENTAPGSHLRKWIVDLFYVRLCLDTPPLSIDDLKFIGSRAEIATDVLISMAGKATPEMFSIQSIRDTLDNLFEGGQDHSASPIFIDCLMRAVQLHSGLN